MCIVICAFYKQANYVSSKYPPPPKKKIQIYSSPVSVVHSVLGNWTRLKSEKGLMIWLLASSMRRPLPRVPFRLFISFPSSGRRPVSAQPPILLPALPTASTGGCSRNVSSSSGRQEATFCKVKKMFETFVIFFGHIMNRSFTLIVSSGKSEYLITFSSRPRPLETVFHI